MRPPPKRPAKAYKVDDTVTDNDGQDEESKSDAATPPEEEEDEVVHPAPEGKLAGLKGPK